MILIKNLKPCLKMKTVKVFGHKSPDTDSICSAIIYSWYLNNIHHKSASPCRLGKINKETEFVLTKFEFPKPRLLTEVASNDRVIIVDTNDLHEIIDLNGAEILEVIDHHKLSGGINTISPVNFTLRTTASTASVIYMRLCERGDSNLPRNIAGLIVAAIISDSINFASPTTTQPDIDIAKQLAKEHGINLQKLAQDMFDAKSDISQISDQELITYDSKVMKINDETMRISVIETNKPEQVFERIENLQTEIRELKSQEKLDRLLVFVIDILNKKAILINQDKDSKELIKKSFTKTQSSEFGMVIPGILSRKKQIIPALAS